MNVLTFFLQVTVDSIPGNAVTDSVGDDGFISYLEFLMKGGVMMVPLILLMFLTLYIIFERLFTLIKLTKQDTRLVDDLIRELKAGKVESAVRLCDRMPNASMSTILKNGVSLIGQPVADIEAVMEKSLNIEIGKMEKGLGYLGLVASIAPILGFIGTILGVITIFYSIAVTEDISISSISEGLYQKMISSGAGLFVAVFAYAGYHIYNIMIDNFALKAQQQALYFIHTIIKPDHEN